MQEGQGEPSLEATMLVLISMAEYQVAGSNIPSRLPYLGRRRTCCWGCHADRLLELLPSLCTQEQGERIGTQGFMMAELLRDGFPDSEW